MHELSIAQNIITIVEEEYLKQNCTGDVKSIVFFAGRMNAIIPESLIFNFNTIKLENKILMNTILQLKEEPIIIKCKNCKVENKIDDPFFICETCGSTNIEIISGKEMYIESIEIDD